MERPLPVGYDTMLLHQTKALAKEKGKSVILMRSRAEAGVVLVEQPENLKKKPGTWSMN